MSLYNQCITFSELIKREYGVNSGITEVEMVVFDPELRKSCESNYCGNYGKNHMCPPLLGASGELITKAQQYKYAIVFNKVYSLQDSYDYEGMIMGQKSFKDDLQKIIALSALTFPRHMVLGVGGCEICACCAAKSGLPCRFPEQAVASLESYCVNVSVLASLCGLEYINGENTVTFFGTVFVG